VSIIPNKFFNFDKFNKANYITATELAKYFSIESRQLNQILTNMKWIKKEHYVWWMATELGKKHGAIEHTIKESRVRYVYWHKDVMYNEFLISTIKNTVRTYIENNVYEEFIKEHFIKQGYIVWHHSKEKTQLDKNKNITLVAKKKRDILLIHCRDNQLDISIEELKGFQEQRDFFRLKNPLFQDYNLTLHYSMSGFFLTEEAYEYVKKSQDDISYAIIKADEVNPWLETLRLQDTQA